MLIAMGFTLGEHALSSFGWDAERRQAGRRGQLVTHSFAAPSYLFATARSKHSYRPIETLDPLSFATKISIDDSFADQDYGALAHHLLSKDCFEGVITAVCWHHGNIPSMMRALGLADTTYPDPWDRTVFNLILDVTFSGGQPSVHKVIEPFLKGGSAAPFLAARVTPGATFEPPPRM